MTPGRTKMESTLKAKGTSHPKRHFKVEIDPKLCKGCYFCLEHCPAGVFSRSKKIGELGYIVAKVEHQDRCTGCRLCLLYCPDFAVSLEESEEERK